jgi:hypothetical protein
MCAYHKTYSSDQLRLIFGHIPELFHVYCYVGIRRESMCRDVGSQSLKSVLGEVTLEFI